MRLTGRLSGLVRPGPGLAILLVLMSSLLYSLGYAFTKKLILGWQFDALQLYVMRSILVLAGLLAMRSCQIGRLSLIRLVAPPQAWMQRAAAAGLVLSSCLAMVSYGNLPVTTATAFSFTAPLLVTVLGGVLLHEQIPGRRWFAVGLGFAGMLIIVRPSGGVSDGSTGHWIGVAAAVGSAGLYAVYQILIRRLRDAGDTTDAIAQAALVGLVMLGGLMPFVWRPVPTEAVLLILASTVAQTGGLLTIAAAVRMGQVSQLAPWQYGGMLWAVLIDLTMFGHVPQALAMVGVGMIVAGGLVSHRRAPR
jgi:drug/metabolite transporter (DMT)-like permease